MWSDWVSNPGPLALESDARLTALHGPAGQKGTRTVMKLTGLGAVVV